MFNFALTGAAGYIAPRHLQAIKDTGNNLVAAVDPHDSVGILDRYFPETSFFTEFERFDRHLEKLKRTGEEGRVHYISICSPNNLHDAHIRTALRVGADALCEKPLVLNPWNLDMLRELEGEYMNRVWTILQLRVHPSLIELRHRVLEQAGALDPEQSTSPILDKIENSKAMKRMVKSGQSSGKIIFNRPENPTSRRVPTGKRFKVRLTYLTSRGTWYKFSWKGDIARSGGIATNIGVHFFDMLIWTFGKVKHSWLHMKEDDKMAGFLELEHADVEWYLGIDPSDLPQSAIDAGQTTFRSITVDGEEIEFSGGFTDLHTRVYERTLDGKGFGIEDTRPSIELVQKLRGAKIQSRKGEKHILLRSK